MDEKLTCRMIPAFCQKILVHYCKAVYAKCFLPWMTSEQWRIGKSGKPIDEGWTNQCEKLKYSNERHKLYLCIRAMNMEGEVSICFPQKRFSKLKTQNGITCRSSHKHASVYWRFMRQHTKRRTYYIYYSAIPNERKEVSRQDSEMQTQIGAKGMQIHLHNSDQSELCDVNSSWSA